MKRLAPDERGILGSVLGSVLALAHNRVEHTLGSVIATTNISITVDALKHPKVTVMVDSTTAYAHQDMKMSLGDLKAGERVVINAKEGADKSWVGISVKWGQTQPTGCVISHPGV